MELLGTTEKKNIKKYKNIPWLEISEVILVHWILLITPISTVQECCIY